ncbi:MAG: hypothetical protein EOO71_18445 [Myxococcaceae bacterium]|nr:MAG: hypothetical protein EOO71_18445 [Myxococcaceae bacterium]
MSSSGSEYVILCEDRQSQVFIERALKHRGVKPRRIRSLPLPSMVGGGAGEQYVREKTPEQVQSHRAHVTFQRTALIIHLDADPANSVQDRRQQLDDALRAQQQPPIGADERIARLIPKRNIETWIHSYLDGSPVDEVQAYPKYSGNESACWPAAEAFADDAQRSSPVLQAPPSLNEGLAEFRRIL